MDPLARVSLQDMTYGPKEDPASMLEDSHHSRLGTAMVERVLPSRKSALLSRWWYILLLPQDYLLLPLGGVVVSGGGVEERSEVIYWHRMNTVIYYMYHNGVAHENNLSDICTNHNNIQSPEPGREWKIREVR